MSGRRERVVSLDASSGNLSAIQISTSADRRPVALSKARCGVLVISDSQPLPAAAFSDEMLSINEAVEPGPLMIFSIIPSMHDCELPSTSNRVADSFFTRSLAGVADSDVGV